MVVKCSGVIKEVRSYASMSGDKTYTLTLRGEDARIAEAIAIPGDVVVNVSIDVPAGE